MNSNKSILQLMDSFLANQDIRETARKRYRENLHVFISWLTRNNEDIRNPRRSDIIAYKEHLIQSGKAATTIDAYLVPVRQFFKWLEEEQIYDNVAAGVTSPKRYAGVRKEYLSGEQVNELLASINRTTIQGKRNYAIINLMCNTGVRCVEISRMDVVDVTPSKKGGYDIVIQGKGHIQKDRQINVPEDVWRPVRDYLASRNDGGLWMFANHNGSIKGRFTRLSVSKIIKHYLRKISIDSKKMTAHSLRHTAAINSLKAGANIMDVKGMLGHVNINTTNIYLRALEAESAEEGTAIRLLSDYYKGANKNNR